MPENTFTISVMTPEKDFFEGAAREVIFSTPKGRIGVMAGHAPIIFAVSEGTMEIWIENEWKLAAVGQGFGEITYDKAEFYLDTAEWADEIDEIRAREALIRAEARFKSNMNRMEYLRTQAAISRALARLKALETAVDKKAK